MEHKMSELLSIVWIFLGNNFEAILALCALMLTINRISVMRTHNRISVKPFLTDHVNKDSDARKYSYSLELINNGLGPAFIKDFVVTFDGKKLDYNDDTDLRIQLQKLLPDGEITMCRVLGDGYAIAAKERCELLNIHTATKAQEKINSIKEMLDKLALNIRYESIYKEVSAYSTD